MADWKEKGYVLDSDEDEDSQDSAALGLLTIENNGYQHDQNDRNKHGQEGPGIYEEREPVLEDSTSIFDVDRNLSCTLRLEIENREESGIGTVETAQKWRTKLVQELSANDKRSTTQRSIEGSPQRTAHNGTSVSSPLSEAPPSLPDLSNLLPASPGNNIREDHTVTSDGINRVPYEIEVSEEEDGLQQSPSTPQALHKSGRSLRHRNAIQLHPYVIEKEKFNQTWRSRGLKPVHILQEEAARFREQEKDSQKFELSDHEEVARSPPADITGLPSPETEETCANVVDDDFPDVKTLLQTNTTSFAIENYKRRKLNSKAKRPPTASLPPQSSPQLDIPIEFDDCSPSFEVLSSKSQSPEVSNDAEEPRFRIPPRAASTCLPTPIPSSETSTRQPRAAIYEFNNSSSPESLIESLVHENPDSASSSDESQTSDQIKNVQRKIKGVLPASWLKLDLMAKTENTRPPFRDLPNKPPQTSCEMKGVARPIAKRSSKHSKFSTPPRGVSESSDKDDIAYDALNISLSTRDQETSRFMSRSDEAVESESIDTMLSHVKRPRMQASIPKRNRRKSGASADRTPHSLLDFGGSLRSGERTTIGAHKDLKKPTFVPPRLGILDLRERQANHPTSSPSFIKIARRTARTRHDQGRHSPTHKYLRMATHEETEDFNETMKNWREGTIAPTSVSSVQEREPLRPRSANTALPFNARRSPKTFKHTKFTTKAARSVLKRPGLSRAANSSPSFEHLLRKQVHSLHKAITLKRHPPSSHHQKDSGPQGNLTGSEARYNSRPAILESSQSRQNEQGLKSTFSKGLSMFDKSVSGHQNTNFPLDKTFSSENPHTSHGNRNSVSTSDRPQSNTRNRGSRQQKTGRKKNPRRVDVAFLGPRSLKSGTIIEGVWQVGAQPLHSQFVNDNRLQGLGPFGTTYRTSFDATPLPSGVRFDQGTYLGSSDFAKSLMIQSGCNLDSPRGTTSMMNNGKTYQWGAWSEAIATEIGDVFKDILENLQYSVGTVREYGHSKPMKSIILMRTVISYFSSHLSFADPVERVPFLQRLSSLLCSFWDTNSKSVTDIAKEGPIGNSKLQNEIRITTLGLVVTFQVHQVSEHSIVPSALRDEIEAIVLGGAKQTLALTSKGLDEFERCQSEFWRKYLTGRWMLINSPVIEAFVITHHIIRRANIRSLDPLECVLPCASGEDLSQIALREQIWQKCFTLLPFLEFDEQGALDAGRRFKEPMNSWNIIRRLISPTLGFYVKNPRGQASSFNDYCRSLFSRCLHLINRWGWYGCDSLIGLLFDFFAKNNLGHLINEESHGSPLFLENLSRNPSLDAEPQDRCFHLLLKIIGSGLKHMQLSHPPKKIRDLVWRLMPNHGRSHPKEHSIRREDLDALRNHHDLLSTLYWASPPKFRPTLNAIRNLVDFDQSHREACHISIRAWFNLVKFQLSTHEPLEHLLPFTKWHSEFLQQILRQHERARSEPESQVRSAQNANGMSVSKTILESTIAQNQQQVEAVLNDALICLELAITAARTQEAAALLLSSSLAGLLNGPQRLASGTVLKGLSVLDAYVGRCSIKMQQVSCVDDNDDSQDYGDWSAFNADDCADGEPIEKASAPLLQLMGPLRTLLSNYFGADKFPQEDLLSKLVKTWVAVSWIFVKDGVKSCDDYFGQFGTDAWGTLRDTDQTRKYAPYFYSVFIDTDAQVFRRSRFSILRCWLGSLVEYESSLKFQHMLTSSLLNANLEDPLLSNLPFCVTTYTTRFDVTAIELSERRLTLISSVLSNMRTSLELACFDDEIEAGHISREYKDLLKHVMMTMKKEYLEFITDSNAKTHYVGFVQHVIEYFQEHTSGICPVDRFFIDGGIFPSPDYDPNYVVGHLKNYGRRLSDPKTPKQLTMFLQSVSERVAADGSQADFVEQLYAAMSNSREHGFEPSHLRDFLITVILPAYLRIAFETSVGWVFAMPFLKACRKIFAGVHLDLDGSNPAAVDKATTTIAGFLNSVHSATIPLIDHPVASDTMHVLTTLQCCFEAVTATLPTLEYALRLGSQRVGGALLRQIEFFKCFSTFVHAKLLSIGNSECVAIAVGEASFTSQNARYQELFEFTIRELKNKLQSNWIREGDDYFVVRGSSRRQAIVKNGLFDEESGALRLALYEFGTRLSTMPALGGWPEWVDIIRREHERLTDDLLVF